MRVRLVHLLRVQLSVLEGFQQSCLRSTVCLELRPKTSQGADQRSTGDDQELVMNLCVRTHHEPEPGVAVQRRGITNQSWVARLQRMVYSGLNSAHSEL